MVEDDVSGVVDASGEVLHGAFAELVDPEDDVVDVSDAVDVVLKDVDAERMEEVWKQEEEEHRGVLKRRKISRREIKSGFPFIFPTQLFLMPDTATTGSEPSRRTLPITESFASAQYRRSLK